MSLKPPWKQKNPLMEKACQAYHKNTAPEKTVTALENLEVKYKGKTLKKEILKNEKTDNTPVSVVMFALEGNPVLLGNMYKLPGKVSFRFTKIAWRQPLSLVYKGETIQELPSGESQTASVDLT